MRSFFKKRSEKVENNLYMLLFFITIELFMSFSFLGYVHIEPLSLTFVYIPVLAAGCMLGPGQAAVVGAVFGLASMWKASAFYVGAGDAIFSPSMSGEPLSSLLLSVGARTLFGLVTGLLFYAARKCRHPFPWTVIVAVVGRVIHTVFVYGFMGVLFPASGYGLGNVLDDVRRWDYLPCTLITVAIVILCYFLRESEVFVSFLQRIDEVDRINSIILPRRRGRSVIFLLVIFSSFSVALYFTNRLETVMRQYDIVLSHEISFDIMHLQLQFLMGMLSLAILVILIIVIYQKNIDYRYYEARLDDLTGLFGRRQFFQLGERLLEYRRKGRGLRGKTPAGSDKRFIIRKVSLSQCNAYFIILDIDSFKNINDTYGHPVGDRIIATVAQNFRASFPGEHNIFGRLGGDEFVALILEPLTEEEVTQALNAMKARLVQADTGLMPITCSVGIISATEPCSLEEMYRKADRLLYEAKKNGKDQFIFA